MTGNEVYERAVLLLGLEERDAADYRGLALGCLNQMLADCLEEHNALCEASGGSGFAQAPVLCALTDEIPYREKLVSTCFPYRLAALLIAGEDRKEYSRLTQDYEERLQRCSPCCLTEVQVSV
jgi:hypothetical protein